MKKRKICFVTMAFLIVLLLLTSCNSRVDTTMTLSEAFSGQREIICTLSGNFTETQESTLGDIVSRNCPSELTYTFGKNGKNKTAIFTLTFSSEEDYIKKLESLLGRKPSVTFRRTNTIFCQGMTLHEDFSSRELLAWLDEPLENAGIAKKDDDIWKLEKPSLSFGGKTYISKGERMDIADTVSYPVDKVTVNTLLTKNGSFDRTVTISIPRQTVELLGSKLNTYLNGLDPNGAVSSNSSGIDFAMSISDVTADKLNDWTADVLDSEHSSTQLETDSSATTKFVEQSVLSENLDYSSFYNADGKVYVNYLFSVEAPYEFAGVERQQSGKWVAASGFDPSVGYIQQEELSTMNIRLTFRKQFALTDVLVYTEKIGSDQYMRTITLQFDKAKGLEGPQTIQAYLYDMGFEETMLKNDAKGNNIVTVEIRGSIPDMGSAMNSMFGEGNQMNYTVSGGLFSFAQVLNWTETIDMSNFLKEIGYTGTIKYTLADGLEPMNKVSFTTPDGNVTEKGLDSEFNIAIEQGAPVNISITGTKTNTVLLSLIAILSLAIIIFLILLLNRWIVRSSDGKNLVLPDSNVDLFYLDVLTTRKNGGVQAAELQQIYPDVDDDAVTKTIVIESQTQEKPHRTSIKHKKKDQYADAMQKLKGISSNTPESVSDAKHHKEKKKYINKNPQNMADTMDIPIPDDTSSTSSEPVLRETSSAAAESASDSTFQTSVKPVNELCEQCGKPLRMDALFCTFCGSRVPEKPEQKQGRCSVCGNTLNEDFEFCSKCGTKVH